MYRLMIVDDEQIVIDAIQYIIKRGVKDIEIAASARSGREAIEKAKLMNPDIILMDIRMPGINGLDAIAEIKGHNPDVKFAMISAYEQFEFAKQAMELGVEHYILKPINRNLLLDTISKLAAQIRHEKEKKKRELENIEKLEKVVPYLEQGFIYSILLNTEFDDELIKYTEILDLENPGGYIMIMQFGEGEKADGLRNKIGSSIIGHKVYPYVRDILKYKCNCIVGPVMINKIVVYVAEAQFSSEYGFRLKTIELATEIVSSISKKTEIEFFIGIGGYKRNQDIIYSYNEAAKALKSNRGEKISHILDICSIQNHETYDIKQVDKLMSKMEMGDEEGAALLFSKIADVIMAGPSLSKSHKKNMMVEYMVMVHRKAMEARINEDSYFKYNEYILEMLGIDSLEDLISWCIHRIVYITEKIREKKTEKGNCVIKRAKSYIEENYTEEITLEELSRYLNISPQYFSRLFKEETGYNFIEYLTFIRIDEGKKLMHSTDMTIKEICYNVGYGDPNYFSRLFKKNTGVSPTTYINMNR